MRKRLYKITAILIVMMLFLQVFAVAETLDWEFHIVKELENVNIVCNRRQVPSPGAGGPTYIHDGYGVTDKNGQIIVEQKYDWIKPPIDGRALFELGGRYGYFDENWNVVIEAKYRSAKDFAEGLAVVADENWAIGYIDRDGNTVIPHIYGSGDSFENGLARVGITEYDYNRTPRTKSGYIDKEGNLIQDFKYKYHRYEENYVEGEYDVLLSENNVEINGRFYENDTLEHPFINYRGMTYLPLTYNGCRMLGINCDWSEETGVVLTGGGEIFEDITGENSMEERVYDTAYSYHGKLTINGQLFEYGDSYYPLLHYKNVVYMPIDWKTGMDLLGISFRYYMPDHQWGIARGTMIFETK